MNSRRGSGLLVYDIIMQKVKVDHGISVASDDWTLEITPETKWFDLQLVEIWRYRDLLLLFVRRDFVAVYKQTVLGPLWFFIQPVMTTVVYTVIFGKVAKIPTDGLPQVLFYMTGITAWTYFADCLTKTSTTFTQNAGIFGKVYFPRIIVPLSIVLSNLIKFAIQFGLLLGFMMFYWFRGANVQPSMYVLLMPLLLLLMAGLGLGLGLLISSLTTKYRDFQNMVSFGVQLLMYATPIIYPISCLKGNIKLAAMANPMSSILETFKFAFLGAGTFHIEHLLYTIACTIVVLVAGLLVFQRMQKNFMDTV